MTEHRKSVTASLDNILKGEVLTRLAPDASPESVDAMLVEARRRFARNALWTIGALDVHHINLKARERLKAAFDEFRGSGGIAVVVITEKDEVASSFQVAARQAGNLTLTIVSNLKESNGISAKHRDAYKKP